MVGSNGTGFPALGLVRNAIFYYGSPQVNVTFPG